VLRWLTPANEQLSPAVTRRHDAGLRRQIRGQVPLNVGTWNELDVGRPNGLLTGRHARRTAETLGFDDDLVEVFLRRSQSNVSREGLPGCQLDFFGERLVSDVRYLEPVAAGFDASDQIQPVAICDRATNTSGLIPKNHIDEFEGPAIRTIGNEAADCRVLGSSLPGQQAKDAPHEKP